MNVVNTWSRGGNNSPECARRQSLTTTFTLFALLSLWAGGALAQETQSNAEIEAPLRQDILQEFRGTAEFEALKEEIKREILQELRNELGITSRASDVATKNLEEGIREEPLLGPVNSVPETHPQAVKIAPDARVGNAEGRMLRKGAGLAGCRVKLVRLGGTRTQYRKNEVNEEYLTTTSADGNYRFAAIPVGDYKIKWELPGETGWIKRIRDVPDVTVISGRTSTLKPIETVRQLAPR